MKPPLQRIEEFLEMSELSTSRIENITTRIRVASLEAALKEAVYCMSAYNSSVRLVDIDLERIADILDGGEK